MTDMTTIEIKARKMDLLETLMSLDEKKLSKVEKYMHKLIQEPQSYEMPQELLNALLNKASDNLNTGNYIEDSEMQDFIHSLQ